jgi:glycosyltransferase involved in cell wall biosynthesis
MSTQICPPLLLAQARQEIFAGHYQRALSLYKAFAHKCPELLDSIALNIYLCSKRALAGHGKYAMQELGSEYIRWIVQAIQCTKNTELFEALPAPGQADLTFTSSTKVSIIMPTWNRANIIGSAIKSVLSQTHREWELLVCDDGSTDNTQELVESFGETRIRYFKLNKANGAVARNHGLRHASGDLIAFLDSDNIWSPIYLAEVTKLMDSNREVDLCYTGLIDATLSENIITSARMHWRNFDFRDLLFRNFIDLNTLCIRSEIPYFMGYFDPTLPRQQDWDLLLRYCCRLSVKSISIPMVCYFRNKEWNQVTEIQKKVDTRTVVMNKNKSIIKRFSESSIANWPMPSRFTKPSVSIKISAPNLKEALGWGDYYYARSLGCALGKIGWSYQIHCQDEWYSDSSDVVLVLRGRFRFLPEKQNRPDTVYLQWIISHPDKLAHDEFKDYDHILSASHVFTKKIHKVTGVPASTLLQATDFSAFSAAQRLPAERDLVFVASSRGQKRDMVEWCYDMNLPLSLYGTGWDGCPKARAFLKGGYILNENLGSFYASSRIVLNDHWPSMRANGFISNRIFDACAAGAMVITDDVKGIYEVFGDSVPVAKNKRHLKELVEYYLTHENERLFLCRRAQAIAQEKNTFSKRAVFLDDLMNSYLRRYHKLRSYSSCESNVP